MNSFEETSLWAKTLATGKESERTEAARERLRTTFLSFRDRAAVLSAEIPQDLRTLTVHDASHLDALWEIADVVIGDNYEINPTEAFILGGAFLLHDLGMSLSSYRDGIADLKKHASWTDIVFTHLQNRLRRKPTDKEIEEPGAEIEHIATAQLLRELHAKHAAELAVLSFGKDKDQTYFLIEDVEIRNAIGHLIGEIAYSHWWSVDEVARHFNRKIGSLVFSPTIWTIDPLKIACILRAADACHLDARRAPGFLKALRQPTGLSDLHWVFQERLQKPTIDNHRLVFSTGRPFTKDDHKAWWLCYETLCMADRELRDCDSVLSDFGRQPFAVRGIAGSEDPDRLTKFIPTSGWTPFDVKVRVGDVPDLVKKLGGASLYGDNLLVPLRELLQNAGDAVRARRIFESREASWGQILVEFSETNDQQTVSVSDTGLGMSKDVLIGPFLDFGNSYWGSALMQREHPGLTRKGFRAAGGFGIGFYSTFMWGDDVKVITRSRAVGQSETLVLHFQEGLTERPVFRVAEAAEQLTDPGTKITITLKHTNFETLLSGISYSSSDRFFGSSSVAPRTLNAICAWLSPVSDTSIKSRYLSEEIQHSVQPNEWIKIDPELLIKKISVNLPDDVNLLAKIASRLQSVSVGEEVVARLGICIDLLPDVRRHYVPYSDLSVVTAGQLRAASGFYGVAGVSLGVPSTASRLSALSSLTAEASRDWANQQLKLVELPLKDIEREFELASAIRGFGGDTGQLRIAEMANGYISFDEIASREDWPDEMILVQDAHWHLERRDFSDLRLKSNVIAVDMGRRGGFHSLSACWHQSKTNIKNDFWEFHCATLTGAVVEALSIAWKVPLDSVLTSLDKADDDHKVEGFWAERSTGEPVSDDGLVIVKRPKI